MLNKLNINWKHIAKVLLISTAGVLSVLALVLTYTLGFVGGYGLGHKDSETSINISSLPISSIPSPTKIPLPIPTSLVKPEKPSINWGGPDLWEAVNIKRVQLGVNPLNTKSELCTIASIRLNELLELGKLDNHEGFSNMPERRPDLKWIFENYSTVAEFLALGGKSAEETVSLWENSLGHKKLLDGGEYVWGCIYAQNTFAVAITAY